MPIPSAAELKHEEHPTITVTIPGTDWQILCRTPDLLAELAGQRIDLPVMYAVSERWQQLKEVGSIPDLLGPLQSTLNDTADLLDKWVCLVVLQPRVVATPEEAGPDALYVGDLRITTKLAILNQTLAEAMGKDSRAAVVAGFHLGPSAGGDAGPDGTPVRPAAVGAAGPDRAAGRARSRSRAGVAHAPARRRPRVKRDRG